LSPRRKDGEAPPFALKKRLKGSKKKGRKEEKSNKESGPVEPSSNNREGDFRDPFGKKKNVNARGESFINGHSAPQKEALRNQLSSSSDFVQPSKAKKKREERIREG